MARNRYGWEKRSKEIARKQKNDEKMKRRQGKAVATPESTEPEVAEVAEVAEDLSSNETEPAGLSLRPES
jgi:hypothetical protein